jgi:hypothetical protein
MVDSARWPCTIQACADRSIPGTFERSARSLRLRNRVWNIPFDADGRLSDLTGDFHPENAAPSTKYGRAELTVEAFFMIPEFNRLSRNFWGLWKHFQGLYIVIEGLGDLYVHSQEGDMIASFLRTHNSLFSKVSQTKILNV